MGQARDAAGNIWETDANGNAVRLIQPAAPATGRVFSLPPNPKDVRQEQRQTAADIRAERADARAARADARAEAQFEAQNTMVPPPGDTTKTGEEYLATLPSALAGQVKALAEGRRAFPTGTALKSPQIQELIAAATQYDPTLDAANAATRVATRKDFTSGKAAQNITSINTALGHLGQLSKAADGLDNRKFPLWNTLANVAETATGDPRVKEFGIARDAVATELMRVFRGTGAGSMQEIEDWKNTISSSDSPEQLRKEIGKAVELLNSRLEAMGQQYNQGLSKSSDPIQLLSPHAQQVFDALGPGGPGHLPPDDQPPSAGGSPPGTPPDAGGNLSLPTDGRRIIHDPRVGAMLDSMINAGAGEATINAALKKAGFPTVNSATLADARSWMKKTGQKYFGSDPTREEDLNLGQRVLANPVIAPVAAGLARAADAGTAGLVGLAAGEKGRGALDAAGALYPTASTLGDVGGGITGAMGLEGAVAARAPAALAKYAPRIADTLYGGLLGFNTAREGEGGIGALEGGVAGLAGGLVGERGMRAVGSAFRGVQDPTVQFLRGKGIPLTVGQTVGNSGRVGATIKGVEDAMTSVPLVGNVVDARRMEGLRGFNQAVFDAAAPPGSTITATGSEGMGQLRQAVGDAYDSALGPARIDATDPAFITDIGDVRTAAQSIPNVNGARDAALAAIDHRITGAIDPTGAIPGRNFQEAYRGLARTGRERANTDYGHEVGNVMRQGQDVLGLALERQNPGAFDAFVEANAANRRGNVIADALKNAGNQAEELVTPAQLNRADIGSTSRLTSKINSATGNRPFYDLATAGQSVLPSKLPDSGTYKRLVVGGLATGALGGGGALTGGGEGAGYGTGGGLLLTAALAAGGSKPAQRIMVNLLTERPDVAKKLGIILAQKAGLGGTIGTGIATPLAVAP